MLAAFAVKLFKNHHVVEIISLSCFSFIVRVLVLWLPGCAAAPAQVSLDTLQNKNILACCLAVCSCAGAKWDCGNKEMHPYKIYRGVEWIDISYYSISTLSARRLKVLIS